jgi:hypothetical protein
LVAAVCLSALHFALAASDVHVQGPGTSPQLVFACCDQGISRMQALFAGPEVIPELKDQHAGLAVAITDFTPERAQLVRQLNQAGIPVVGWILLSKEQGFYLNADDVQEAAARFAAFDAWTHGQGLRWQGVGLDIEPNFAELAALKNHPWRLVATMLYRSLDFRRMSRAREGYSVLIREIHARGYVVQIYQMPYIPVERSAHSSLLDRLLGTADVRGDLDVVMLYTSFAPRSVGPAILWKLGPDAQAIAVGVTDGPSAGALNWEEFSRDLIVAGHFSRVVGVYNLEGCVRQGFLPRLQTMDWGRSVTIPAKAIQAVNRHVDVFRWMLWICSLLPYFIIALLLAAIWLIWRRLIRRKRRAQAAIAAASGPSSSR